MHARIEQLLSLRDGEPVDLAVREHVAACPKCTKSLTELGSMRERLQALREPARACGDIAAIHASIASREAANRSQRTLTRGSLAASIAIIAIATAWRLYEPAAPVTALALPAPNTAHLALAADRLEQLRSQSEALEDLLAELPHQSFIEREGTALPIDTIEAQVQWLDHQILLSGDDVRPDAAEQLWRERVEAMNSLVRLRYADAQRVAM